MSRVHTAIDSTANVTKTVWDVYHGTFFSEEASERYEKIGTAIGDGIVSVLERMQTNITEEEIVEDSENDD